MQKRELHLPLTLTEGAAAGFTCFHMHQMICLPRPPPSRKLLLFRRHLFCGSTCFEQALRSTFFFADTCCPKASSSCFPQAHAHHKHSFSQLISLRKRFLSARTCFRKHVLSVITCILKAIAFSKRLLSEGTCFPKPPAFRKHLLLANTCFPRTRALHKLLLSAGTCSPTAESFCFPRAPPAFRMRLFP